jgi:hypothetical protein
VWYSGVEDVRVWAETSSLSGEWRWKVARTSANGQPALGFYAWHAETETYRPFALNMLTLQERAVDGVVAFIARATEETAGEAYERFPRPAAGRGTPARDVRAVRAAGGARVTGDR